MRKSSFLLVLAVLMALAVLPARSQNIEDFVSKYTESNGKGYMQPLANSFGACMNSGLYHSAKIPVAGLHLYVGVETMMAVIGDKAKTFSATTEEFTPKQTVDAPTLFGATQPVVVNGSGATAGLQYVFPGGMNIKRIPLAMPQVTVGSIMGTEASLRWLAVNLGEDIGKLSVFGWGVRHSISQYLPLFPVNLAAGVYMQSFKVGDVVDASATYFGVQASKSFTMLSLYGGIGMESSKLNIAYESKDGLDKVKFDLEGKNGVRLTIGAALNFPGLTLHADYNMTNQNILAAGIGIQI
jgi:hypothetical protein